MNKYAIVQVTNGKELDRIVRRVQSSGIDCEVTYDASALYYKERIDEVIEISKYKEILTKCKEDLLDEFMNYEFDKFQKENIEVFINHYLVERGLLNEQ